MNQPFPDMMPLEWVRAFEAAGRLGSFTGAALETGLTQAAISQRIGHLEARLGAPLFVRKGRGVSLTVEGEAWLPFVSGALEALHSSAGDLFGERSRKITIAASSSVIQHWLLPRLSAFTDETRVQISFRTVVVQDDYSRSNAPLEIRYASGGREGHRHMRLFAEALSPVCTPELARRGDWRTLPKIALSGPRPGWQNWARLTGDPTTPVPQIRFDTFSSALTAALNGAGVLLASLPLCQESLRAGHLLRLTETTLEPAESYWLNARNNSVSKTQWGKLTEAFCA